MDFLKRLFLYIIIILLVISIFNDLSLEKEKEINSENTITMRNHDLDYVIYKVKVNTGDTVLSIIEELNKPMNGKLELDKILSDFKVLNPEVDPYQLQANTYYYFPMYHKNGD